jgi:hypothetical protein
MEVEHIDPAIRPWLRGRRRMRDFPAELKQSAGEIEFGPESGWAR